MGKNKDYYHQDVLYSDIRFLELFDMINHNIVYKGLELIGVYESFDGEEKDFHQYYCDCTQVSRYCYRNRGVDVIYREMENCTYTGVRNRKYKISKHSIKRTGITYKHSRVRVYEGTYEMIGQILKYIESNDFLFSFYTNHIHNNSLKIYLDFQNECIEKMCGGNGEKRKRYYLDMRDKIRGHHGEQGTKWFQS